MEKTRPNGAVCLYDCRNPRSIALRGLRLTEAKVRTVVQDNAPQLFPALDHEASTCPFIEQGIKFSLEDYDFRLS